MRFGLILIASVSLLMLAIICPVRYEQFTIIKDQIKSNRPFAGMINDRYVGDELCVEYWLAYDECPDTAIYLQHTSLFGVIHCTHDVTDENCPKLILE
jgi:hypothetical protein